MGLSPICLSKYTQIRRERKRREREEKGEGKKERKREGKALSIPPRLGEAIVGA